MPPYSPDFNPVEQAWSKLRAAQARSRKALIEALQGAIDWISSADALGWFNQCGYHVGQV